MKRLLLFLSITILCVQTIFGQAPVNDLIQNAILVDESPFVDSRVRILDGSVNNGGQQGCDLIGYSVVHYKFNTNQNKDITITVEDAYPGASISSTFVIIFTSSNLNATINSELTSASACAFSNIINNQAILNFTAIANTNYYILIHRQDNGFSKITIDIPQDVDVLEKNALIDLFNNADNEGSGWTSSENWNSGNPVSSWHGITVKNGHVSKINLVNNNLNGTIPSSIESLSFLEDVNFSNNRIYGELPDFGQLNNINNLTVTNNDFSFQDLETNYSSNSTIANFNYQTQNKRDMEESFDGVVGNGYMLSMTEVSGTSVQYQWYKKRYSYYVNSDDPILSATISDYTINPLTTSDMDAYVCKATSAIIPDLIIERNSIEITGEIPQLQKDALIAIYNSTNGDNWNNNTNWLSNEPLSTWYGVKVKGNKITELNFSGNNLIGTLPIEIGDLEGLEYLSFYSGNNISGNLPETVGNLTELRLLSFEDNNFTGEIPASYANLTNLSGFWLWNNKLSGSVPEFITTFNNLVFLDFSENQFSGTLPDFTSLPNLRWLHIGSNNFNATDFITHFEDYKNLQYSWNSNHYFSPQYTKDESEEIGIEPGSDITLTLTDVPATAKSENSKLSFAANTYQWYKDNVGISGANSSSYTINNAQVSDSGIYYCTIINPDVPDLIIEREPITLNVGALNIQEIDKNTVSFYPNPTTNIINIKLNHIEAEKAILYDISGKRLLDFELQSETTIADISQLKSGVYILKMKTTKNTIVKRIIKK